MSGAGTYVYSVKGISLSERKNPRTGKKRKPQTILMAARHNLREIQAENGADYGKLNPTKMHLNERLAGPEKASEVEELHRQLFKAAGIDQTKLRKDYSQASEHILSLKAGQEERGFFSHMVEFFKRHYGADNILSAIIHRDQEKPHIHILVSPISGGKFQGAKLHDKKRTKEHKKAMAKAAKAIGFAPRTGLPERQTINDQAAKVIAFLEHHQHPLLNDPAWPAWLQIISTNPAPLFEHYKLDTVSIPKTMAQDRLRKPEKRGSIPIGIGTGEEKGPNLSCVGFGTPPPQIAPPAPAHQDTDGASLEVGQAQLAMSAAKVFEWFQHGGARVSTRTECALKSNAEIAEAAGVGKRTIEQAKTVQREAVPEVVQAAGADQIVRVRDSDLMADSYDPETGEFYKPPPAQPSTRTEADRWVREALRRG